jgi:S1-C subfamily serine protease
MRRFGFLFSLAVLSAGNAVAQNGPPLSIHIYAPSSHYSVGGLALGEKIALGRATKQGYQCADSKKFEAFAWCTKKSSEREARGAFKVWMSLMLAPGGQVVYVNRYQEPAYWGANEVKDDIQRYSKKVNQEPRIIRMPTRPGLPKGTLATWGDVVLEPIVGDELNVLAADRPLPKGIAIDFIGDFTKSARQGLPIYRLSGGGGFVWAASYDESGRGTLRFVAVDASAYTQQPVAFPPSQEIPTLPRQRVPSRPDASKEVSSGSAFAVSRQGHLLTNNHVISGCARVEVAGVGPATVLSTDVGNDLALIQIHSQGAGFEPVRITNKVTRLGEEVVALGYPLRGVLGDGLNVTTGTVSALSGLGNDSTQLQFTAPIQPGNSGGALVDRTGALVGVVASKLNDMVALKDGGFVPQGVNFAIRKEIAIAFLAAQGMSPEPSEDATYNTVADIAQRARNSVAPIVCRN